MTIPSVGAYISGNVGLLVGGGRTVVGGEEIQQNTFEISSSPSPFQFFIVFLGKAKEKEVEAKTKFFVAFQGEEKEGRQEESYTAFEGEFLRGF